MNAPDDDRLDLRDLLRPLWLRKWIVLALVVVAPAVTYAYFSQQAKEYTAETSIFIDPQNELNALVGQPLESNDRNTANQAELVTSRTVADAVAARLGRPGAGPELLGKVTAAPESGEDFIRVRAVAGSAREAADLANGFATEYVRLQGRETRAEIDAALERLRRRLDALPRGSSLTDADILRDSIRRLRTARELPGGAARQVDPARPPARASAPRPARDALFAFALALLVGVALAFGLERLDRRLKRPEDVEAVYGSTLLAALPHADRTAPADDGAAAMPDGFREPFRMLRTNLQLAALEAPVRRLLVTSAGPGEGKSTAVRNLALVYREWGARVAVVDADLRRPTLDKQFGVAATPGLTEVLTGQATLAEAARPARVRVAGLETLNRIRAHEDGADGAAPVEDLASVTVLPSGTKPANPQAVLATNEMAELLDRLSAEHDIVIVDSAPLLAVSDAVPLLPRVDGVLVVARLGSAYRDDARRLQDLVGRVPEARLLGVIANDLTVLERAGAYGYGYAVSDG